MPLIVVTPSGIGTQTYIVGAVDVEALMAVVVGSDGTVSPVYPTTIDTDGNGNPIYPVVSGVSLNAANSGEDVTLAVGYGAIYEYDQATWNPGGLLYVAEDATLTQNYESVVNLGWIMIVGRAVSTTQFVFQPHIPNLMDMGTF